jgi:hypothetical protein
MRFFVVITRFIVLMNIISHKIITDAIYYSCGHLSFKYMYFNYLNLITLFD